LSQVTKRHCPGAEPRERTPHRPASLAHARPSIVSLWPPDHKLVAVTITVLAVTQDEALNGLGEGDTGPGAVLQGSTVLLRAERSGRGRQGKRSRFPPVPEKALAGVAVASGNGFARQDDRPFWKGENEDARDEGCSCALSRARGAARHG
jgi:hypothetical protein